MTHPEGNSWEENRIDIANRLARLEAKIDMLIERSGSMRTAVKVLQYRVRKQAAFVALVAGAAASAAFEFAVNYFQHKK